MSDEHDEALRRDELDRAERPWRYYQMDAGTLVTMLDNRALTIRELRGLLAMSQAAESRAIEQAISHWFAQGGEAEFGAFEHTPTNADELVSEILRAVRRT